MRSVHIRLRKYHVVYIVILFVFRQNRRIQLKPPLRIELLAIIAKRVFATVDPQHVFAFRFRVIIHVQMLAAVRQTLRLSQKFVVPGFFSHPDIEIFQIFVETALFIKLDKIILLYDTVVYVHHFHPGTKVLQTTSGTVSLYSVSRKTLRVISIISRKTLRVISIISRRGAFGAVPCSESPFFTSL